jgi:hypothetical protein
MSLQACSCTGDPEGRENYPSRGVPAGGGSCSRRLLQESASVCPDNQEVRGCRSRQRGGEEGLKARVKGCRMSPMLNMAALIALMLLEVVSGVRVKSAERRMRPGHEEVVRLEKACLAKPALSPGVVLTGLNSQYRYVMVPAHRFTPVKLQWAEFARPIVQSLKLQIRMNLKKRMVEIRSCQFTQDFGAIDRYAMHPRSYRAALCPVPVPWVSHTDIKDCAMPACPLGVSGNLSSP